MREPVSQPRRLTSVKRFATIALFGCLFTALGPITPPPAHACSCMQVLIEDAITDDTPAAFVGTAVAVEDRGRNAAGVGVPLLWTFEVERVLAGELPSLIEVASGYGDADCGFDFSKVGRIGVVAYTSGAALATSICGGIWDADDLLAAHGPGVDPVDAEPVAAPPDPEQSTPRAWLWIAGGLAVIGLASTVLLGRRRRDEADAGVWRADDG